MVKPADHPNLHQMRNRFLWVLACLTLLMVGLVIAIALKQPSWPSLAKKPPLPSGFVPVVKVHDGDTIEVKLDGKKEKVRLVGVDTPETVDPRRPVQCYGKEASDFTKQAFASKAVRLQSDTLRGESANRDKYGRLLRYAFRPDGKLHNQELIRAGYGLEYTFSGQRYEYQTEFKAAEREAKSEQRGLWSPATCAGDAKKPA